MLIHKLATLTGLAVATLFMAAPANALTMAECSTKYNAAKDGGTLNGQTWNQFRKAECGTDAAATTETAKPAKKAAAAKAETTKAAAAADDSAKGLTAKECSAKYQAAKAAGTLNGAKWNDFRKTECAAGASAAVQPAKATTKAAAAADDGAKGLTAKECSAKYQAAKAAGTLNGVKWNDFRKTECAAGASAAVQPAKATTKAAADSGGKGLSMADCSAKYQAAKSANTLGGKKWNDFRKAECGAGADDDDTVPAPSEATYTSEPEKPSVTAPKGVKFPTAISKKYASETPAKGRMHTCLELYYANKDANTLNGLRWIQKGGGFYSLCNAKLKS
ncbi:hypothetical protein FJV76_26855 [Mesorhizobium sp. WSM4303]|uniref:hypothetical protein n=1 Tax=unclassified Mesorhizobium TaxID=325217 RepID=UPI00115EDCB3|nr:MULTISPECIES: hypothetical protein [unclassified Mesorhizobium]TRC90399.1 hypothetical protein FJV77_27965 [Mesorhizobium sp. WSM4306]TRC97817.1 hypothetical protein FJV76_26855 [Mesorhizobium sp. WSM4303]